MKTGDGGLSPNEYIYSEADGSLSELSFNYTLKTGDGGLSCKWNAS